LTAPTSHDQPDAVVRAVEWISKYRNRLITLAVLVAAVVLVVWYFFAAQQRREEAAARDLAEARAAAAAGNVALAASDLARVVESYDGTVSAEEAAIELARIRLSEGQAAAAMVGLRELIASGPRSQFVAPAHGLLGAALEQDGSPSEAAAEYRLAADGAWYDFLKAQYLLDAARAQVISGDTTSALGTLERVTVEFPDTDQAVEARVRAAELEAEQQG
jgi:TolA-binding protein